MTTQLTHAGLNTLELVFGEQADKMSPRSKELAKSLVAAGATTRAVGTVQNGVREIQRFAAWRGSSVEQALTEGSGLEEALYLEQVRQEAARDGVGPARVLKASAGIASMAALHGRKGPGEDHPLCTLAREAAKMTLKATPLERGSIQLRDLVDMVTAAESLSMLMTVTGVVLSFAMFLRPGEIMKLLVHLDLFKIYDTHIEVFLYSSKTDKYMDGTWLAASAVQGHPACPVALVKKLLVAGDYRTSPSDPEEDVGPLIRAVTAIPAARAGGGPAQRLRQLTARLPDFVPALSSTAFRERFLALCTAAGIPEDRRLLPHSGRIGGATEAAARGVPDRLYKKAARWNSERVKDRYTRETLQQRISVSAALYHQA